MTFEFYCEIPRTKRILEQKTLKNQIKRPNKRRIYASMKTVGYVRIKISTLRKSDLSFQYHEQWFQAPYISAMLSTIQTKVNLRTWNYNISCPFNARVAFKLLSKIPLIVKHAVATVDRHRFTRKTQCLPEALLQVVCYWMGSLSSV